MGQLCPKITKPNSKIENSTSRPAIRDKTVKKTVKIKILRDDDKILIKELQERCSKLKVLEDFTLINGNKLVFDDTHDEIKENDSDFKYTPVKATKKSSSILQRIEKKNKRLSEINMIDHINDEASLKIKTVENIKLPTFLTKLKEIKKLCHGHMIDQLYNNLILDATTYREKTKNSKLNFFKENLIKSLKKNENVINVYLAQLISDEAVNDSKIQFKKVFFKLRYDSEIIPETGKKILKSLNFIGFTQKKYFSSSKDTNETNPKLKNKQYIVILNQDPRLLGNNNYLCVKIFKNGKLFAGRFNNDGVLNGRGIYIDKKGNLFLCEFVNSEIETALIYGSDNTIYRGKVLNYRKHGSGQTEHSESYQFVGDFEKGKKVKGVYNMKPRDSQGNTGAKRTTVITGSSAKLQECAVRSIEIDEKNLTSLKKTIRTDKIEYSAKYLIKSYYDDSLMTYVGRVIDGRLNGQCLIYFDKAKMFPSFQGNVKDNQRLSGKYSWNEKDFYEGMFRLSLFHSKNENQTDEEQFSVIKAYGREFKIVFENGRVTMIKDITKLSIS